MHSRNIADTNVSALAELFPNCVTESTDADGNLQFAVDFDLLRQALSTYVVEGGQERYVLNWPGKRQAIVTANAPISKSLRPCREQSVEFDSTRNLFIEADNLDALKLILEAYLGKVRLIYIDPPYNTGNDFIYSDKFAKESKEYLRESGQVDQDGNRLIANTESNGRFHSDWLSMMYSRLKLARQLLSGDGLIFISIGQEELPNLRKIMDEIFGADNYRNSIMIRRGPKSVQAQFATWDKLGTGFEYLLLYSKTASYRFPKMLVESPTEKRSSWNNHWRGTDRPNLRYELLGQTPSTGQWRWKKDVSVEAANNFQKMLEETGKSNDIGLDDIDEWYEQQDPKPKLIRLSPTGKVEHYVPASSTTLLNDVWNHIKPNGSHELDKLFDMKVFDNPKPIELITQVLRFCDGDSLVLDFFAGSSTTAHAVMNLNQEDGGNRNFIMVQYPEPCDENSNAFKKGYKTISDISKERLRRVGQKIRSDAPSEADAPDTGFRVLTIDSSCMTDVFYAPDDTKQENIEQFVSNIKDDRSSEDLLFQVMLDLGIDLSLPITTEQISGRETHFVDTDYLAACFLKDGGITEDFCKELAKRQPQRVAFLDSGFKNDSTKINVEQIFKLLSPHTVLKTI